MQMNDTQRVPASREKVWAGLNNPDILRKCIPGCQSLEMTSPTQMTANVVVKVGPVKATFAGKVHLSDLDPPNGYRISGEGSGGVAGFAKGGATVKLLPDGPDATNLQYAVDAQIGGKLAQLGGRLIDSTAKKLAGEFFQNLASELGPLEPVAAVVIETPLAEAAAAATSGLASPTPATAASTTAAPAKGWLERLIAWFMGLFRS